MVFERLKEELKCSVCLNIYTDPVTLRCGHSFCRVCIERVLDTQGGPGSYSCPECREKLQEQPVLQKNITLCNIVHFLSFQPDPREHGTFCTHCIHFPVPAVKSCLLCDAFLCHDHLKVHKKSPEHVLTDLTLTSEKGKCLVHKERLRYFCTEDGACICESCYIVGDHQGHQLKMLDEVFKNRLRQVQKKVMMHTEETEERVQNVQERRTKALGKADDETEKVTALFTDLRRQLEDLEKRVLSDITKQAEQVSLSCDDEIQRLEVKEEELSRKMGHVEELCNMTDPLSVLQEVDVDDFCETDEEDEDRERRCRQFHDGGGMDVSDISHTLHKGIADIIKVVNAYFYMQEAVDMLLDVKSSGVKVRLSDDRRTAYWSYYGQHEPRPPETPERFRDVPQVLGCLLFSSGPCFWEVDVSGSDSWSVGVCYPSIGRKGLGQPRTGWNNKSWALYRAGILYSVIHNKARIPLADKVCSDRVRIYLDYEAGQISFYDLCDPIRHIYTFTATFTEPLHAVFGVFQGCIKMLGGNRGM